MARTHYENFTVGSWLLPQEKRRHVYAIYGYCRSVDDLGDEATSAANLSSPEKEKPLQPSFTKGGPGGILQDAASQGIPPTGGEREYRLALLDWWEEELEACYRGTPSHPVMVALQETIQTFQSPPEPFLKLIQANRMDQGIHRHPTFADLLHYCDHSANPVGHLFLYLFGYRDQERQRLADCTCTALQLANFWQDVARDYRKGRIYLPLEDMERFGYTEEELSRKVVNHQFRQLMALEVSRAVALFQRGSALVEMLEGPVKLDVALFTRGGMAVLRAIQRQRYDVLSSRPSLSRSSKGRILLLTWLAWKLGLGLLPSRQGGLP
jgi:squalene synthase HpnC